MGVERHYTPDGRPAYVILYKTRRDGSKQALRLVYPKAADFGRLWDKGRDAL